VSGGPDVIHLRGIRAVGICGALPEERERPQPFEVDLDVVADLARAGDTDDLDDTVDYGQLAQVVVAIVTDTRFVLLERMAQTIATAVLAADRVEAVTVTVRKLRPPVPVQLDTAGVTITRTRGV
jgi:dihydroneopterin aldolase